MRDQTRYRPGVTSRGRAAPSLPATALRRVRARRQRFTRLVAAPVAVLLFTSVLGFMVQAAPAQAAAPPTPQALINSDTVSGGASSVEASQAAADGFNVTTVSGATWDAMTAAQFAGYQVLIAGDPNCGPIAASLMSNESTWAPVVMGTTQTVQAGNRVLIGTDPVLHSGSHAGALVLIADGIAYAGGGPTGTTGLYFDTTCGGNYDGQPGVAASMMAQLSTGTGAWAEDDSPPCGGNVSKVAQTPAFSSLTSADIQGWGCSVHETFPAFASDWSPLAIATDASTQPTCGTDTTTLALACGQAYVLIAGAGIVTTSQGIALTQSTSGSDLTVTATLTSGGTPIAGQLVDFTVTGQNAGVTGTCAPVSCVTDSNGAVSFTYASDGTAGTDTILASFTANGSTQQASTFQTWMGAPTVVTTSTVTSSITPSVFGQPVTFATSVDSGGTGTPTGAVEFWIDGVDAGGVTLTAGAAALAPVTNLAVGAHTVTATYRGDATFIASTAAALTQSVNVAHSTTNVVSSANPSVFGQPVTFTATTLPISPGGGTPTGDMAFFLDGQPLDSVTMVSGTASTSLDSLSPGNHVITAVYPDTTDYVTSSGVLPGGQDVTRAGTATTLTSSANPANFGQAVSFTATVTPSAPGAGTPTGNVTFYLDGSVFQVIALAGGPINTITISSMAVGPHTVTATYAGDASFTASASDPMTQSVAGDGTTTTVVAGTSPSVVGQPVTFTATVDALSPGAGTPTGQVTFNSDGTAFATGTVVDGLAVSPAISSLAAGIHVVGASYDGDTNFMTSVAPAISQTVNQAATTVSITSSSNPSIVTQNVLFTVTVSATAPGGGTPDGTVQFTQSGSNLGPVQTLDAHGVASVSTSALDVGSHPVTAVYAGTSDFAGTTGTLAGGQGVTLADSTTTLTAAPSPSTFGQAVSFTVVVASTFAGTPGGTVQYFVDGISRGAPQTLTAGSATLAGISDLATGTHAVTATYSGDATYAASTGATSLTVQAAGTTTIVATSPNPASVTQTVTFSATVAANDPGIGTPTGSIQFAVDGVASGSPVAVDGSGAAMLSDVAFGVPGSYAVSAQYLGDASFAISTAQPVTQVVTGFATTTRVTTSLTPSRFGQPVTFTALVDSGGHGTPTGTVQFAVNGANVGGPVPLDASGTAVSAAQSTLDVGTSTVTAAYAGVTNDAASTGTLAGGQTIVQSATTSHVVSSANPSVYGQPVTFTATVAPMAPGAGTPSGSIAFFLDGQPLATVALAGGTAATSVPVLALGNHIVTVRYPNTTDYQASSDTLAGGQTVRQANTTTTLTSSGNPSAFGQPVSYTATVLPVAPGAGTPTGDVTFFLDGTLLQVIHLADGLVSTISIDSMVVGTHTVTATYAGDAFFVANGSAALSQVVGAAATTTTAVSGGSPSVSGQPVTFTANVTPVLPGAGTPTGTVQFFADGTSFGAVALTGARVVSPPIASLRAGVSHTVTASYSGNDSFMASTSEGTDQAVNRADAAVAVSSGPSPAVFGQAVTFSATVTVVAPGQGTPTGQVQFNVDGTDGGSPALLADGAAASTDSSLAPGDHVIIATYLGDAAVTSGAAATTTQHVDQAGSSTAVASSASPSAFGQAVTFTASVGPVAPSTATPSGQVQFVLDGVTQDAVPLTNGSATLSTSSLSVGTSHSVSAFFVGNANFVASAGGPITQTVVQSASATTVSSSQNPSASGQAVHFSAQVSATGNGAGTPTGTVQFTVDGAAFGGPVALAGGSATSGSSTTLTVGNHTVVADYSGDTNFTTSSGTQQQVVNNLGTSLVLTASPDPTVAGATVVFTATVGPVAPATGTPTGLVQFSVDGMAAGGAVALSGGVATTSIANLSVGSHAVRAVYAGDGSFAGASGSLAGGETIEAPPTVVTRAAGAGYWLFGRDGGVFTFGDAVFYGSTGSMVLNKPVIAMTSTPDGRGYWLFASDGGVFAFGDAGFFGSTASMRLNGAIVAMASTPDGRGYWLFASDGGVFAFGDAGFFGSSASAHLGAPVVAMAATPNGQGYWLVQSDGSVSAFGSAGYLGGLNGLGGGSPVVGMAITPSGRGYWLVTAAGGVHPFGDAGNFGSLGAHASTVVGVAGSPDGQGYWLVTADGGVFSFGDAGFYGSMGGQRLNAPMNGITLNL